MSQVQDPTAALIDLLFEERATGDRHKVVIERYLGGFRAACGGLESAALDTPTDALAQLKQMMLTDAQQRATVALEKLRAARARVDRLQGARDEA